MAEKEKRGFASMDRQKQREIASKGGRAAHAMGTAHEFTAEEARAAGRKGGEAVSRNRQHMAEIGRRGGQRSRSGKAQQDSSQGQGRANERGGEAEGGLYQQEAGGRRRTQ